MLRQFDLEAGLIGQEGIEVVAFDDDLAASVRAQFRTAEDNHRRGRQAGQEASLSVDLFFPESHERKSRQLCFRNDILIQITYAPV